MSEEPTKLKSVYCSIEDGRKTELLFFKKSLRVKTKIVRAFVL